MTGGIVIGGWEFVWAAYGLTFLALGAYGTSLALRLRAFGEQTPEGRSSREARDEEIGPASAGSISSPARGGASRRSIEEEEQ